MSNLLNFLTPLISTPELFGNDTFWWCVPLIALILAIFHLCWGSTIPDSPKHLYIYKQNQNTSMKALIFYHGETADLSKLVFSFKISYLDEIAKEYEEEKNITKNSGSKLKALFQDSSLR